MEPIRRDRWLRSGFGPAVDLCLMCADPLGGHFGHALAAIEFDHHGLNVVQRQLEVAQELHHAGCAFFQLGVDDGVDMAAHAVDVLRVFQRLERELRPDAQRFPGGDHDPVLALHRSLELGLHGRGRAGQQFHVFEVVGLDRLLGVDHDARPGLDARDAVLELGVMRFEFGDGVDGHILRHGQAQPGAFGDGAQIDHVFFVLVPIHLMGGGQPGGEHGVGTA